jgi:hypothetical protein
MTFTRTAPPTSFRPYQTLVVCSNSLIGGGHIVSVGDVLPLIIGAGDKPQIWLQAISDPKSNGFISVVENSVSTHPAVEVREVGGAIVVSVQGTVVVRVRQVAPDRAEVDSMDLRPIGLNLYGNSSSMNVAGGSFSGNSMSGGGVLIGLG